MPKLIPSLAVMLKKNDVALRKENDEMKAENARLRAALAEAQVSADRPILTSRQPLTDDSAASYMRPTISSSMKIVAAAEGLEQDSIIDEEQDVDRSRYYLDGRLVRVGKRKYDYHHYMQSTQAWRDKARRLTTYGYSWASVDDEQKSPWDLEHEETQQASTTEPAELECQRCTELEDALDDTSSDCLAARSRLFDNDFYRTPAARIILPARVVFRVLASGLAIAQDTLWNAMRTHWPDKQQWRWLKSPRQVQLGQSELQDIFGGEDKPRTNYNNMCGGPSSTVNGAILSLPELRNTVAHQNLVGLRTADGLLEDAQHLAVVLKDERRAFKVRDLRDTLQTEALKALEEIKSVNYILCDPLNSHRQWKILHQRTFREVIAHRKGYGPDSQKIYEAYPDFVKHAAAEWTHRYPTGNPGQHNAGYLATVKKAKSYMRETPAGDRHGSVSGGLATLVLKPVDESDRDWWSRITMPKKEEADPNGWGGEVVQCSDAGEGQTEPVSHGW